MNPSLEHPTAEGQPDPTCWACQGAGTTGSLDTDVFECTVCDGTGLSAQHRRSEPDNVTPTCDASCCAGREIPWPDALNPHLAQPGYTPRPYGQGPGRRTVSLEVLTDELRLASAEQYDDAKVGVVLRIDGVAVAVPEVDVTWGSRHKHPVTVLEAMLRQAQYYEADHPGADLLMPGPGVLAALDGRPDATLWSVPVPVTARHIEEGWLVVSYSGPGMEERVEAKNPNCGADDCPWPGDCTQLTIGDDKPQHFADWTTLTVRIPASVTR